MPAGVWYLIDHFRLSRCRVGSMQTPSALKVASGREKKIIVGNRTRVSIASGFSV